jgi:pyrimidine-nucleoside phosphorylase
MSFLAVEIIKRKRDGFALTDDEIRYMINSYTKGELPDYQMSAWLMAIYFRNMTSAETLELTRSMLYSGEVIDLKSIPQFKIDKHSTGGVGDKTSLLVGPIVAAAGLAIPMIAGRGLAHTGGTLDKLESIPGFNTQLNLETFKTILEKNLFCLIGQTKTICPADKKIYALRDVTATVDSIPLICASILSKKVAEGIDGLVLDVKYGSGAFMRDPKDSEALARELISIGRSYGLKVHALITNMDQPLGRFAGNSLEIQECVEILRNQWPSNQTKRQMYMETRDLSVELAAYMLWMGKAAADLNTARSLAQEMLTSGKAEQVFERLCRDQGGSLAALPTPKNSFDVRSSREGYLSAMNAEQIGMAGILLKAGRATSADVIEHTAGIEFHAKVGDFVKRGQSLFTLYGADANLFPEVATKLLDTVAFSSTQTKPKPLILKVI